MHVRITLAALGCAILGSVALGMLGGYSADGFAWESLLGSLVTLLVCGSLMAVSYYFMLRALKVRELDAFLAPILAKVRRQGS